MRFWLGTHETSWLQRTDVPLFISHTRLRQRVRLPRARGPWALDSGGFTELDRHGGWRTTVNEYVEAVALYSAEIGRLAWAAPMDWMCEPHMLAKTGLTVREHQERTVQNYLDLRDLGPFIPVLQGWTLDDYEACIGLYLEAGVDLWSLSLVGIGSVCRRQSTSEIEEIVWALGGASGLPLHGFGVKARGLDKYATALESADSMAWSYQARRNPPLEFCSHKSCANCIHYAMRWRDRQLLRLEPEQYHLDSRMAA